MTTKHTIIPARACKTAAAMFNYGNLIAVLLPPLAILWLGASMVIYAMNRHHPNEMVGQFTQQAAYRFYGLVGLVIVVATFFSPSLQVWLVTWAVVALIIIPWSIYDLIRIARYHWQDSYIEGTSE